MRLLDRINRTGTTVVIATHDAGMVDQMRRRVIELDHGVLVRDQARGVYGLDGSVAAAGAGSPTGLPTEVTEDGPDGPMAAEA
jgi:energy-coupling factor transporter ATP-binding protein EcfA2